MLCPYTGQELPLRYADDFLLGFTGSKADAEEIKSMIGNYLKDKPYKVYGGRTELVKRLLADKCELCGSTKDIEVHHIRKLADLKIKGQSEVSKWAQIMSAWKRKTLVVCRECHVAIYNGSITKRS